MITHSSIVNCRKTINGSTTSWSASELDLARFEPAKVSGAYIDLPGGGRFRKPTNYGRSEFSIQRGNSTKQSGTAFGKPYSFTTSAGGRIENLSSWNWRGFLSSSASVNDFLNPPSFSTMEENESITKALNKIGDSKLNLGENLATLGLTARLLLRPVKSFADLALALERDGGLKRLARYSYRDLIRGNTSKRIADAYLAYVYGAKPLMQDIYALTEIMKKSALSGLLLHGSGTANRSYSSGQVHYNNVSLGQDEYMTGNTISRTRTTLWARIDEKYAASRALNQLGLLNPVSLVWELVPFSFCVDWFLPIGPVLEALTAPAGLAFVGGSTSRRVFSAGEYQTVSRPHWSVTLTESQDATGTFRYDAYNRKSLAIWPRPGLWYDPDPLRLSSDKSDRTLKGLALTVSRMRNLY